MKFSLGVSHLFRQVLVIAAVLSTGLGMAVDARADALSPAQQLNGKQAFSACAGCHSNAPGAAHKVGPNLFAIVGRSAASAENFDYSPALRNARLRWTRETLFAWIAGSEALVPDSWMLYDNFLQPEEVMALIDYLEDEAKNRPKQTALLPGSDSQ